MPGKVIDGGTPEGREIRPKGAQPTSKHQSSKGGNSRIGEKKVRMPQPKGHKEEDQAITAANRPTLHLEGVKRRWVRP